LYQNTARQTKSTGLKIQLNTPTDAAKIAITLADFDLDPHKDTFFRATKVNLELFCSDQEAAFMPLPGHQTFLVL